MPVNVEPITPTLGAEVTGLNLASLSDADFKALWQAFVEHSVVFLRDQPELTVEEQQELALRFGSIHVHPAARGRGDHAGAISMKTTAETRVAAGNRWHSDVSCDAEPPQASILQLHEIPEVGGDTLFSSLYAAYEALSDRMKDYLDGMTARHSGEEAFRHLFGYDGDHLEGGWPVNDHPLIRKHVDSGRPALFVDREFTASINDLPTQEGRALLDFLLGHVERVDFQCRFRWSPNAIAIWDNRCVLHHAMWDYFPQERRGRRISIVGEKPVAWQRGIDPERVRGNVRLTL